MSLEPDKSTKHLPIYTFDISQYLTLHLTQSNSSLSHGTTVWDAAKILSHYLISLFSKSPPKPGASCIELGSGCGLCGFTMAGMGFQKVILTDLQEVVESVLEKNLKNNFRSLQDILENKGEIMTRTLDWVAFSESKNQENFDYILAADCIYETALIMPFLKTVHKLSSITSTILICLERRDNIVVDEFVRLAREGGFDIKMISKKFLKGKEIGNEDVEVWKLKKKRNKQIIVTEISDNYTEVESNRSENGIITSS